MSTSFPTTLDVFPSAATLAAHNLSTDPHSTLHGNLGDALAAVEAKVGVNDSVVVTSLDRRVATLEGAGPYVPQTTTVNGHALSSSVIVSASDLTTGTLTLAHGGTSADLSATGGTSQLVKQSSVGAALTVAPLLASEVPAGLLRGYIDGLILSNDGSSPNTVLDIAAGTCRDSTDAASITLGAVTKILNSTGSWTAGTGNNGLDTGARASSTWYHVYAISKDAGASPDVLFSTSASAPTMPSTYTLKRRIGSIATDGSGNILAFKQTGDLFSWTARKADITATNPGTAAVTRTLSTPTGIRTRARLEVGFAATTPATDNPAGILITDLDMTDVAPSSSDATIIGFSSLNNLFAPVEVLTNTSSQVRSRLQVSAAATTLYILTIGWLDPRGKDS